MAGEIGSVQDDDRVILGGNGGLCIEGCKKRGEGNLVNGLFKS